ncbi:hypothetical protein llap_83 [Limosa lapponica baueri]|uniref:Uncharacterized protein n=1 Tax=Limosa lapponica baueri TaxID=1758121 RepID=A0A2I0UU17_LIMLA|nr:hypothetical protein llap_83 [Limosa lapponica baueri]
MKRYLEKQGNYQEMDRTGPYLITWYFKSNSELTLEPKSCGMDTSHRPEALGNPDDIAGKERREQTEDSLFSISRVAELLLYGVYSAGAQAVVCSNIPGCLGKYHPVQISSVE